MRLDEQTLLAYVTGQLDGEQAADVEAALEHDVDAQKVIHKLRAASPEMIKAAFDVTLERPVSSELVNSITSKRSAAGGIAGFRIPYAIAVSVILLATGLVGGYVLRASVVDNPWASSRDAWILSVAQYQVLYGRETLALPNPSAATIRDTEVRLGNRLGLDLHIPDLSDYGVAFKRGQILSLGGNPLVQLAYVPEKGKPIAYCITTTNQPDSALEAGVAEGLELFHWRRDGFAYVIIGETDREALRAMALSAFNATSSS